MSASNPLEKNDSGQYHFEMKQKIPSYLIALAVGDMTYIPLGDNCGVYAEKELASACEYEFHDLPKMIKAASNLYGDYKWEQYDIVMLPFSFPFGGMENPRLTFANPTLLTGDRSSTSVIAHELAHSWSGNLVRILHGMISGSMKGSRFILKIELWKNCMVNQKQIYLPR